MPNRLPLPPQPLIKLTQQEMHVRLIGRDIVQDHQLHKRELHLLGGQQDPRLLEARQGRPRREFARPRVLHQRRLGVLEFLQHDADAADEDGVGRIDARGGAVVPFRHVVLALFFKHLAEAVPSVVVSVVGRDAVAVGRKRLVVFLAGDVFVTLEREGVGEFGVELGGAFEASERLVVVAVEGEGVSDCAPGLGGEPVEVDEFVGEVGEVDVAFEVPEDGRVDFHVFEAGWRHGSYAGKVVVGFGVVGLLVEGAADLGEDPGSFSLLGWDGVEDLEGVLTLIMAQGEIAAPKAL